MKLPKNHAEVIREGIMQGIARSDDPASKQEWEMLRLWLLHYARKCRENKQVKKNLRALACTARMLLIGRMAETWYAQQEPKS